MTATEKAAELRRLERRARELRREIKKARPKTPRPKAPGKTRDERRKERNKRAAEIRASVMKRAEAQGGCEWCPEERKSLAVTLEWHHLLGGGQRRYVESVENTAGICWDCHRGWERSSTEVLAAARQWAIRLGFRDALRAIDRRTEGAFRVLVAERSGT